MLDSRRAAQGRFAFSQEPSPSRSASKCCGSAIAAVLSNMSDAASVEEPQGSFGVGSCLDAAQRSGSAAAAASKKEQVAIQAASTPASPALTCPIDAQSMPSAPTVRQAGERQLPNLCPLLEAAPPLACAIWKTIVCLPVLH